MSNTLNPKDKPTRKRLDKDAKSRRERFDEIMRERARARGKKPPMTVTEYNKKFGEGKKKPAPKAKPTPKPAPKPTPKPAPKPKPKRVPGPKRVAKPAKRVAGPRRVSNAPSASNPKRLKRRKTNAVKVTAPGAAKGAVYYR